MSGNSESKWPIKAGFNTNDYICDLRNKKKIFKIMGLDFKSWHKKEPDVVLECTNGEQWVCHSSELHLRFERLENQKTARILYNNSKRGAK